MLITKYGKKAREKLIEIVDKTTPDKTQKTKMINASSLSLAIEELYLSQLKNIMNKDWKSYANIFPDKGKYEAYMELLNRSRSVGAHTKTVSTEDELMYNIAFEFFENALSDY